MYCGRRKGRRMPNFPLVSWEPGSMGVAQVRKDLSFKKWAIIGLALLLLPLAAHAASPSCTLSVSPTSGNAPLTVAANGNCTDQDNDLNSITLNWGDGSPTITVAQGPISETHTYSGAGQFRVSLTGLDATNNQSEEHVDVTVSAPPPPNQAPTCSLTVEPSSGQPPLTVVANANCQDADNNITSVRITWGDGSPPTEGSSPNLAAQHTYSSAGSFTVTATATDSGGLTGSASKTVK